MLHRKVLVPQLDRLQRFSGKHKNGDEVALEAEEELATEDAAVAVVASMMVEAVVVLTGVEVVMAEEEVLVVVVLLPGRLLELPANTVQGSGSVLPVFSE